MPRVTDPVLGPNIRAPRRQLARRATALCVAAALAATSSAPSYAQPPSGKGLPIIRDAEIEQLLRDYMAPILKTAGLAQQNIQIVIIQHRAFNAFVMDGRRIFINVGALLDAKTPNEVIGVLAHETGHLAGGHLAKLRRELANAQTALDHRHAARPRRRSGRRHDRRRTRQRLEPGRCGFVIRLA